MVHRCHGSVRTSVQGSRFDTISVQQGKKKITVVQIKINIHLDVKILIIDTNTIITLLYYI